MPRWTTRTSPLSSLRVSSSPGARPPVILAPSSRAMNCFLGMCRVIAPDPVTSTVLMRLPTDLALEVAADGLDLGQLRHPVL